MSGNKISRRSFLRTTALLSGGAILAACSPQTVIVKETQVVEKEVTSVVEVEKQVTEVVKETVIVEGEAMVITATPAPKTPMVIDVNWWGDQMADTMNKVAAQYAEMHPDFVVNFVKVEHSADLLQVQTWFQSGDAPVLMTGGSMNPENAIKPGFLSPFDPYLELPTPYAGNVPWKDTLYMEWLTRSRYEGDSKIYKLPTFADQAGNYFNKKIFDELKLTPPTTWDEWISTLQVIKDAGYDAFQIGGNTVWMQGEIMDATWRHAEGDFLMNPDFKVDLNDSFQDSRISFPENWVYCALQSGAFKVDSPETQFMIDKMLQLADYFPEGSEKPALGGWGNADLDAILLSYVSGKLATFYGAGWMLPSLQALTKDLADDKKFDTGYFTLPGWGEEAFMEPTYGFELAPLRCATGRDAGNANFAIYSKAPEDDRLRAVDFLMYLYSPEAYSFMVNDTIVGQFPLAKNVPNLPETLKNPPAGGPAILTHGYGVGTGGEEYYIRNVELFYQAVTGDVSKEEYLRQYVSLWGESWATWEQLEKDAGRWPKICAPRS